MDNLMSTVAQTGGTRLLFDVAVVVDPERDNVAVVKEDVAAGTTLTRPGHAPITVHGDVYPGHRFAIRAVPAGEWVRQYGQPFAVSRGLAPGDPINNETVENVVPRVDAENIVLKTPVLPPWEGPVPTFQGFRRPDGRAGVRNLVLVVPTSMCSSHEAAMIAMQAELGGIYSREKYPNVDGVVAIPHTRGCGCLDMEPGAAAGRLVGVVEASMKMLGRYVEHPNVAAVLVLELGCEKTNLAIFGRYIGKHLTPVASARPTVADFGAAHGKPVLSLSVQQSGGSQATIRRGLELLPGLLAAANAATREPIPVTELAVGLKCGGSDGFSGLTANPALGVASDLLVRAGGTTMITEVPEFFGAEHLFAERAVSRDVAQDIFGAMDRFRAYVARVGGSMSENPAPGNKEGGLLNITIKSLGALAKSGSAPVQGVVDYADLVWDQGRPGLYLLYCPSYDQESTPALVASGCQIVCFTTGRGTGIGNAIAPVIKIGSTSRLYARMGPDIDINAGTILDGGQTTESVGREIFDAILAVASGVPVKAEGSGHREFMIWSEEGVSL
jgi:altronate hydrolase